MKRQHLCRTTGRSKKHDGTVETLPDADNSSHKRGLARTCITAEDESLVVARIGKEGSNTLGSLLLVRREGVGKLLGDGLSKKVGR